MPMVYRIENNDSGAEAFVEGMVTFKDHNKFFEIINAIKNLAGKKMVLNLSKVEFIDSAALGMLVIANEEGTDNNVEVVIKGVQGKVKNVMEAASFDKLFKFE